MQREGSFISGNIANVTPEMRSGYLHQKLWSFLLVYILLTEVLKMYASSFDYWKLDFTRSSVHRFFPLFNLVIFIFISKISSKYGDELSIW